MKNKKLFLFSGVALMSLTSCNSVSRINRQVYTQKTYEEASKVHTALKEAQVKDNNTTLFDNGVISFSYNGKINGTLRYEEMSFHELNINLSGKYDLSWSLSKNYLKIKGEKETIYYIKNNEKFYHLKNYQVGSENVKEKEDITDDVNTEQYNFNFANYIVDCLNYYTTLSVPFAFNITAGVTGEGYDTEFILPTNFDLNPDYFYEKEHYDYLTQLRDKYAKDSTSGYYLDLAYGVDNNQTCFGLKGRGNSNDFHLTEYRQGAINIDGFVSWKNNFISQFETIVNGNIINSRKELNVNANIDMYIAEEVKESPVTPDTINISEYKDAE